MPIASLRVWPGAPYPLGATWDGIGVNFALFSEHATRVELCLFNSAADEVESLTIPLLEQTDMVWHGYLPDGSTCTSTDSGSISPAHWLASALARELHAVDKLGAFFDIIHQDPVLSPDADVTALRARQRRNFLGTLLMSVGVPMISGGDERGERVVGDTLLVLFNAGAAPEPFLLPEAAPMGGWEALLDTADPWSPARRLRAGDQYELQPRSMAVLRLAR